MALRDLATGADGCAPDGGGGAGPSNAAAALADALLGRPTKAHEGAHEVRRREGERKGRRFVCVGVWRENFTLSPPHPTQLPGVGPTTRPGYAPPPGSVQAAALAAAQGALSCVGGGQREKSGIVFFVFLLRSTHPTVPSSPPGTGLSIPGAAPPPPGLVDEFLAAGRRPMQPPPYYGAAAAATAALAGPLASFLGATAAGAPFRPPPASTPLPLPLADQVRLRDRVATLARQLAAGRGEGGASVDAAVAALLASVGVDARSLPPPPPRMGAATLRPGMVPPAQASYDAAWAAATRPAAGWAAEYEAQRHRPPPPPPGAAWAAEYGRPLADSWAEEHVAAAAAPARAPAAPADTRAQSAALASALESDPAMARSQFASFVGRLARGEVVLDGNTAVAAPPAAVGGAWAEEAALGSAWRDATGGGRAPPAFEAAWADASTTARPPASDWADAFAAGLAPSSATAAAWADEYAAAAAVGGAPPLETQTDDYQFTDPNPFLSDADPLTRGLALADGGLLTEATLALEAAVRRAPGDARAWRALGDAHAANDDDARALAALRRAAAAAPGDAATLLALGVAATNELDGGAALRYLADWLRVAHPAAAASLGDGPPSLPAATAAFAAAASTASPDAVADAAAALGVVRSLARDYGGAADAFRSATRTRPADAALWNRLGATLANAGAPGEAAAAYQRALDLRPNYTRAWANMGIAHTGLGDYDRAARFYARALTLNPTAAPVWGYVRTALACAGRGDLLEAADAADVGALSAALPL